MVYQRKDYYFKEAKNQNYTARSVFKLKEIHERFKVFKLNDKVLDLGAAPGSWSQYASQQIGLGGRILGIDLQALQVVLPNAVFICGDLRNLKDLIVTHAVTPPFDVVLSDMAPKTTGIRVTDQARSIELCELALEMSQAFLRHRGTFICKMFHSEYFESFRNALRKNFKRVEVLRPKSTRKASQEIFFIALQYDPDFCKVGSKN